MTALLASRQAGVESVGEATVTSGEAAAAERVEQPDSHFWGSWLGSLPEPARKCVLDAMSEMRAPAGSLVFSRGEAPSALYQIRRGRVRFYFVNARGNEVQVTTYHEGQIFGECACVDGLPRPVDAMAQDECVLGVLAREDLLQFRALYPDIDRALLQVAARTARLALARLCEASGFPLRIRIASRLHDLALQTQSRGEPAQRLMIAQHDLAMMVGGSRQAVNKALAEMQRNGIIATDYKMVIILDPAKLEKLASPVRYGTPIDPPADR